MRPADEEIARDVVVATAAPKRLVDRPFHPFLFAVLPVISLMAHNAHLVSLGDVVEPAAVALGGTVVVHLALYRLGSRKRIGALRTTVLVVWFAGYGHVANWLAGPLGWFGVDRHLVLLPLWTLVAITVMLLVGRVRYQAEWTRLVNVVGVVLVASGLVVAIGSGPSVARSDGGGPPAVVTPGLRSNESPPDVYYLVFDRYADSSSLEHDLGFDNGPFLDELRERGFLVPASSYANYTNTLMSLTSTLNMRYLDWVADQHGSAYTGQQPLRAALQDHQVGRLFRSLGYRYLHIGSIWEPTRTTEGADHVYPIYRTSEFSATLQRTTVLKAPIAWHWLDMGDTPVVHRKVAERQFEAVDDAVRRPGPKFVFAHILLPHPPYVFDAQGGRITDQPSSLDARKQAYLDQLRFTNARILDMVDAIRREDVRSIVVLQADEGPNPDYWSKGHEDWTSAPTDDLRLKLRVLNALHLPGADTTDLMSTFSSVNTFRIILNQYFGTSLDLLDDTAHLSSKEAPFRFESMPVSAL